MYMFFCLIYHKLIYIQSSPYLQEKKSCNTNDGCSYIYPETHGPRVYIVPDIQNPVEELDGSKTKDRLLTAIVSGLVRMIVLDHDVIARLHHDRVRQFHV
jgi:hypothetical protein